MYIPSPPHFFFFITSQVHRVSRIYKLMNSEFNFHEIFKLFQGKKRFRTPTRDRCSFSLENTKGIHSSETSVLSRGIFTSFADDCKSSAVTHIRSRASAFFGATRDPSSKTARRMIRHRTRNVRESVRLHPRGTGTCTNRPRGENTDEAGVHGGCSDASRR